MTPNLLDVVVLTRDLPADGLRRGDLGAVVDFARARRLRRRIRRGIRADTGAGDPGPLPISALWPTTISSLYARQRRRHRKSSGA